MKLSMNWLRELVDLPDDVERFVDDLTMLGLEVEAVDPFRLTYPNVVVGQVLESGKHPNADKLSVCKVTDGAETFAVVCGASNVRAGLKVAFARPGAVLPGDFKIKKAKIRGEVSLGMICSERELNVGDGHEGIIELAEDAAVGTSIDEIWGYDDVCVEIEVTPNRPDWLSHIGVARELAAWYKTQLRLPDPGSDIKVASKVDGWKSEIEDPDSCIRFTGRAVKDVRVGDAPWWMRRRLLAIGQRPINAVVDCSNYVLLETGQPNHCFDQGTLRSKTIGVRHPKAGEKFTTLDGQERELFAHHLVIADGKQTIGLAGLMGGQASEVTAKTTDLILEVAAFNPRTIRRMRRDLGMSTDASYRFERGVDSAALPWVSRRLGTLIVECCGGEANSSMFEANGTPPADPARFFVRQSQVRRVLGVDPELDDMRDMLQRLEIPVESAESDGQPGLAVVQPSFRHDLREEVDAIEEIARHYGYDNIPVGDHAPMLVPAHREPRERLQTQLRTHLAAAGFHEVVGSSFMDGEDPSRLALSEADRRTSTREVLNPLVAGQGHLKTTSVPEMLRFVDRNRRRGFTGPLRLFQLDRCFLVRPDEPLAQEDEHVVMVWAGPAQEHHSTRTGRTVDPFDTAGDVESMLRGLGIAAAKVEGSDQRFLAAGTAARLISGGTQLGWMGAVSSPVLKRFDLEGGVMVAQLDLNALQAAQAPDRPYQPISIYPPVRRDLSLVTPDTVPYAEIAGVFESQLGQLLESHDVFDLYQGEGIPTGHRAIGVRLVLRSHEGTLKDKKVDALLAKTLDELESGHAVKLRSE